MAFFLTRMLPTCKYNKTLEIPFQSNTFFFIFYNLSYTTLVIPHKWIGTTVESAMIKIAHAPVLSVLVGAHLSLCTQAVLRFPWWTWGNWGSEWWERLEMSFQSQLCPGPGPFTIAQAQCPMFPSQLFPQVMEVMEVYKHFSLTLMCFLDS